MKRLFNAAYFRITGKRRLSAEEAEKQEVLAAVRDLREKHRLANLSFEYATDPEQVEASVYELKAIQARYDYLIRLAREMGATEQVSFKEPAGMTRIKE